MKYIPNRTKVCRICKRTILYNQTYVCVDRLDGEGNITSDAEHMDCVGLLSNSRTYAVPGSSAPWGTGTGGNPMSGVGTMRWTVNNNTGSLTGGTYGKKGP